MTALIKKDNQASKQDAYEPYYSKSFDRLGNAVYPGLVATETFVAYVNRKV